MDVKSVLHMNSGQGETSYAQNSALQGKNVAAMKGIIVSSALTTYASNTPERFTIADLGCSSGTNSLALVRDIVHAVHKAAKTAPNPEFLVFLNDLPTNDFNALFQSLADFSDKLKGGAARELEDAGSAPPSVYLAGLPGSFYGRLFPSHSLHFVSSCSSLHWLSRVPEGLLDANGKSINRGKMYISSASPAGVVSAYLKQFQKDFGVFLRSRSAELHGGGRMAVSMLGRKTVDHSDKGATVLWKLLDQAFAVLVSQEVVAQEKVDAYNVPFYAPSIEEIKDQISIEGSFTIEYIDNYEMNTSSGNLRADAKLISMTIRAIQESMISHHFGDEILEPLFEVFGGLLNDFMMKEEIKSSHVMMVLRKS